MTEQRGGSGVRSESERGGRGRRGKFTPEEGGLLSRKSIRNANDTERRHRGKHWDNGFWNCLRNCAEAYLQLNQGGPQI